MHISLEEQERKAENGPEEKVWAKALQRLIPLPRPSSHSRPSERLSLDMLIALQVGRPGCLGTGALVKEESDGAGRLERAAGVLSKEEGRGEETQLDTYLHLHMLSGSWPRSILTAP